jgi:hypothetical protein
VAVIESKKMMQVFAGYMSLDMSRYMRARRSLHAAENERDEAYNAIHRGGMTHSTPMRAAFRKAMEPHTVEFDSASPLSINYDNGTVLPYLGGEIWPKTSKGNLYSMQVRAPIKFSLTPRDVNEFERATAMLKAMADAATAGGL